jgi:hypothetical protein
MDVGAHGGRRRAGRAVGLREMADRVPSTCGRLFDGELAELWRDRQKAVFAGGQAGAVEPGDR